MSGLSSVTKPVLTAYKYIQTTVLSYGGTTISKDFWKKQDYSPVAGLGIGTLQIVLLKLESNADVRTSERWLAAVQLAQIVYCRLLEDLRLVETSLEYWKGIAAGPTAVSSASALPLQSLSPASLLYNWWIDLYSPTESAQISEKVVLLAAYRDSIAQALSAAVKAADSLRLEEGSSTGATSSAMSVNQGMSTVVETALTRLWDTLLLLENQTDNARSHYSSPSSSSNEIQDESGLTGRKPGAPYPADLPLSLKELLNTPLVFCKSRRAADALSLALSAVGRTPPIACPPSWALRPSHLRRHLPSYLMAAALTGVAARWLYLHSRLGGSDDLEVWTARSARLLSTAAEQHVLVPLRVVRDEVFRTFRDRPSIVSLEEFEADKASLERMLSAFEREVGAAQALSNGEGGGASALPANSAGSGPNSNDTYLAGMVTLMTVHEQELKNPLRNLLMGQLARSLLIQVQRLKVDMEAAMLELDQVLRANELTISLVAALPALGILALLMTGLGRLASGVGHLDSREAAVRLRLAVAALERELARHGQPRVVLAGAAGPQSEQELAGAMEGLLELKIWQVYTEAIRLHSLLRHSSLAAEWPDLYEDLLELARPVKPAQRLNVLQRMMRTYSVFQRL